MFITIEALTKSTGKIEFLTTTPNETFEIAQILDNSERVIGWNLTKNTPEDFGWGGGVSWKKYKTTFTESDYGQMF